MDAGICDVLVIGGGPAGLRAAELVSAAGWSTVLADQKPSVGRKFLVAGRGGLNLTHSEPIEKFHGRYDGDPQRWQDLLAGFSPADLRAWAEGLGIETFIGTSGRIFPTTKQAAPLLRRWIARLRQQGVIFRVRHAFTGFPRAESDAPVTSFTTPEGPATIHSRAVIFALGGASWPQTGSDGGWTKIFSAAGLNLTPFTAANCGYEVAWPREFLAQTEGLPLKNIVVSANGVSVAGELLITKYGLEGGAIYQLGPVLRSISPPQITIDLKPTFSLEQLLTKCADHALTGTATKKAAQSWRLSPVAQALLATHPPVASVKELAALVKAFPLTLLGPRPIAEAISSAGGVSWDELDPHLMLTRHPGIFCSGEMIDWTAPTGGYLLQGCFSTATRAALGADQFLKA